MVRRLSFPCAALLALVLVVLPAAASATTTATRAGTQITITGDDGPNVISVNSIGNYITYEDKSGPYIVAGAGCFQESPTLINCGQGGFGLKATVVLGGGDDTYDDRFPRNDWPVVDLDAGDGNDVIFGGDQGDVLRGGAGNDQLRGTKGDDQIDGGAGDDTIHGGGGSDTIVGGAGRDTILGDGDYSNNGLDAGNDTIQARDGEVDSVACGFGADTAVIDAADVTDGDIACETLDRPAAAPGPPAPAPTTPPGPAGPSAPAPAALTVALGKPRAVKLGALAKGKALSLTITPSANCVATIKLKVKTTVIAQALKAAPAGRVGVVLVVKKPYRARLRRASSLKATLTASCVDASGAKATASLPLTLRR